MTRFARRGTQKAPQKVHEASSWKELKRDWKVSSEGQKGQAHTTHKSERQSNSRVVSSSSTSTLKDHPDAASKKKENTSLARKRERRREEKRLKRMKEKEKSQICNFCGVKGHQAGDCPCSINGSKFGACTECGSTDHVVGDCKGARLQSVKTLYTHCNQTGHQENHCPLMSNDSASDRCPICSELGHQMKSCPDNPRSIYPVGGSCGNCGSVEHKSAHCPERESVNEIKEVQVTAMKFGSRESADAVEDENISYKHKVKTNSRILKRPKVVVF